MLKEWEILPSQLKVEKRSLGAGQFGIVKQGFYTSGKGDPVMVAIKMLKGTEKITNMFFTLIIQRKRMFYIWPRQFQFTNVRLQDNQIATKHCLAVHYIGFSEDLF